MKKEPATFAFDVSDVLSITTERLVSKRGIQGVYEILNWMTNDNLMTHQLPRAGRECKPWLLRWFPELIPVETKSLDKMLGPRENSRSPERDKEHVEVAVDLWITYCKAQYKLLGIYNVPRIPRDDHEIKDPVAELVEMGVDSSRIVTVQV